RMDGQMVFSSGWEWGYWLNDVIAARAAWQPPAASATDRDAFTSTLAPVVRPFGGDAAAWTTLLADIADAPSALLILGRVDGHTPDEIDRRTGIAYLEGFDAMADVAALGRAMGISSAPSTQPDRLGLVDLRDPFHGGPDYESELRPLLEAMDTQ